MQTKCSKLRVAFYPVAFCPAVPEMTYKVSSGTLNLCSLTHFVRHSNCKHCRH